MSRQLNAALKQMPKEMREFFPGGTTTPMRQAREILVLHYGEDPEIVAGYFTGTDGKNGLIDFLSYQSAKLGSILEKYDEPLPDPPQGKRLFSAIETHVGGKLYRDYLAEQEIKLRTWGGIDGQNYNTPVREPQREEWRQERIRLAYATAEFGAEYLRMAKDREMLPKLQEHVQAFVDNSAMTHLAEDILKCDFPPGYLEGLIEQGTGRE